VKREFILAMSIFVTMAIVGTAFGLWYTSYLVTHSPNAAQSRN
jgi:hypothetical protein